MELIEEGVEEKEGSGVMSLLNREGDDDEFADQMYREKVPGWWWWWYWVVVMVVVRILDRPWLIS